MLDVFERVAFIANLYGLNECFQAFRYFRVVSFDWGLVVTVFHRVTRYRAGSSCLFGVLLLVVTWWGGGPSRLLNQGSSFSMFLSFTGVGSLFWRHGSF